MSIRLGSGLDGLPEAIERGPNWEISADALLLHVAGVASYRVSQGRAAGHSL